MKFAQNCFSSMMQVRDQAASNAEESQIGLLGFLNGGADVESKCPHDGCASDILPNKVVCRDHFLDAHNAHSPGLASQVQKEESSDDEPDDDSSSSDEDDDGSDDGEDLRDFIVSDGEDDDSVDAEESEGDESEECQSKVISRTGTKLTSELSSRDEAEKPPSGGPLEGSDKEASDDGDDDEASTKDDSSRQCDSRASSPDRFAVDQIEPDQAPACQPSPLDEEDSSPALGREAPLGNDIWGLALSRIRGGETAIPAVGSDSDSESDLESLSAVVTKFQPKPSTTATGSSKQVTANRKRKTKTKKAQLPKKRPRKEHEDPDEENEERPRKLRKGGKKDKKKDKKGKAKTFAELKKLGSTSKAGKIKYFDRLRRDWESSAKVDVTIDLLRTIRSERPNEKTLVFSLWTSFLDLLEIPLQDEKFRYLRYDGGMNFNERDDNIKEFTENPRENILLVSLMAGNAGLNLTAASQVIMLEPFWNPFVESQAIDRAHRIGQKKEVRVHRLLVPDSVEDRILELQEKKRHLVNTALSKEGAQGASRLSIGELRGLFGLR